MLCIVCLDLVFDFVECIEVAVFFVHDCGSIPSIEGLSIIVCGIVLLVMMVDLGLVGDGAVGADYYSFHFFDEGICIVFCHCFLFCSTGGCASKSEFVVL